LHEAGDMADTAVDMVAEVTATDTVVADMAEVIVTPTGSGVGGTVMDCRGRRARG
jgi:hypothetical protein